MWHVRGGDVDPIEQLLDGSVKLFVVQPLVSPCLPSVLKGHYEYAGRIDAVILKLMHEWIVASEQWATTEPAECVASSIDTFGKAA